jgi:diguanylate cyclase (GGDEF)-like protein
MVVTNKNQNDASNQLGVDTVSVLHIESNDKDKQQLSSKLNKSPSFNYLIQNISSNNSAKSTLLKQEFDIIFLSLNKNTNAITLNEIRKVNQHTPIIVLTDAFNKQQATDYFDSGAQDYIQKDEFTPKLVERTIRYALERKKAEDKFRKLTHLDPLTKLCNRSVFLEHLYYSLEHIDNTKELHVGIILLDIDNFKSINASLGHNIGDALLIQIANRIQHCIRGTDLLARLGNDEFTIVFDGVEELNIISKIAENILHTLSEPYLIDNKPIIISVTIGVSTSADEKNISVEKILKNATIAMQNAKKKGGDKVGYFTRELKISTQIKSNLENTLQTAIEKNQLKLFFQPQLNIESGDIAGAEALIRWDHPKHGLLPPNSFIAALDETGLIHSATDWIIYNTLEYWENISNSGVANEFMSISINIPPSYIHQGHSRERINQIVDQFSINKNRVKLELTENAFIDINSKNLETIKNLKDDGYQLAIDDFGTGYSSLSHLKAFPIDCIKLDRLFIKDIINSSKDIAIAEAMIQLCQKLGIELIAEGVDTQEKLNLLKYLECKLIQGFYFSKPLPQDRFIDYVNNFTNLNKN